MRRWQLQEAKARFSELVKLADSEGPQEITVRGEPKAVVVSKVEFERLRQPKPPLTAFLRGSPLAGLELEIERERMSDRTLGQ